jgi:hypothetical protein
MGNPDLKKGASLTQSLFGLQHGIRLAPLDFECQNGCIPLEIQRMPFHLTSAFEISSDDVILALETLAMPAEEDVAEAWLKRLDRAAIARAALDGGDDLATQTEAAQAAIQAQLLDLTAGQRLAQERLDQGQAEPVPVRGRERRRP